MRSWFQNLFLAVDDNYIEPSKYIIHLRMVVTLQKYSLKKVKKILGSYKFSDLLQRY